MYEPEVNGIPEDELEAFLDDLAEDMASEWDYQTYDDSELEDDWTRSGLGHGEGLA
jgi:cell division septum initiation protein DivIVA